MMFELTPKQFASLKSWREVGVSSSAILRALIDIMESSAEFREGVVNLARENPWERSERVELDVTETPPWRWDQSPEEDEYALVRAYVRQAAIIEGISESVWIARFLLDPTDSD
jgi:hypothetical protein